MNTATPLGARGRSVIGGDRCFIIALLRLLLPAPSPWEDTAWVNWLEGWQNVTCNAFTGVKLA